jgi:hypothetical protein
LKVTITSELTEKLSASGLDSQQLASDFANWQANPLGEYSYYFGKDALNRGSSVLRHVHMIPLNDEAAIEKWNYLYDRERQCTSDRYLFYVNGEKYGHLLIAIIDDPNGHNVWEPTPENRKMLRAWELIASDFLYFGKSV